MAVPTSDKPFLDSFRFADKPPNWASFVITREFSLVIRGSANFHTFIDLP
jgi:hypothetical protein